MPLTQAQLKTTIVNNLNDVRISAIAFFLEKLISRNIHGGGIEQYRVKDIKTDTFVTNLADLISRIDETYLKGDYNFNQPRQDTSRGHSISVISNQFVVEINSNSNEDRVFSGRYGSGTKIIQFGLNYFNDLDTTLPLKIYDVAIISGQ